MKERLVDRIPDYLLGVLADDEMRQMERRLAESPDLAREVALLKEALALRASTLRPIPPSAAARKRLLATLDSVDRFRPFFGQLCKMLDLTEDVVRQLLARIDDASGWQAGPVPGLFLSHFAPGPAVAPADAGFVRITAGHSVPRHRHLGPEATLVLEGTLWMDGVRHLPGEPLACGTGSVHELRAGGERDLVFVVTHHGIEIV